ncbi:hypothetical protein [Thermomonas flagellata]|uniref:hypothetical protein n=1 Tax=Thermomonas flagellata TaxID=2888524 RepID=UPI001F04ABBC|nr:hypothetical protein [Thermomonas flagellata]
MKAHALLVVWLAFSSLGGIQAAHAANAEDRPQANEVQDPGASRDWTVQVTPYLWASGLAGNISPFRSAPTLQVDKSFSQNLKDLNFGGFANLWARRGRVVFSADLMYVDTTGSEATGPLPALQIPGLGPIPPGATVDAEVDTTLFTTTVQGGYRVLEDHGFTFDVLGGVRYWRIRNDVKVTVAVPGLGARSARHGERFDWVDPVLGARAFVPLSATSSLLAQLDVGGFGAGSHRTWSVLMTYNHVFSERLSGSIGYKLLDADYDHHGHVYDTRQTGPVLGLTWRF